MSFHSTSPSVRTASSAAVRRQTCAAKSGRELFSHQFSPYALQQGSTERPWHVIEHASVTKQNNENNIALLYFCNHVPG